jgi:hypothetical protein
MGTTERSSTDESYNGVDDETGLLARELKYDRGSGEDPGVLV